MAKYQSIDAGVSWELANRIESIWNADQTKNQIAQQNDQLQQQADTASHNADLMSDDIKDKEIDYQRRYKGNARQMERQDSLRTERAIGSRLTSGNAFEL